MLIEKFKKKPNDLFASMFWNMLFAFLPFNLVAGVLALLFRIPINVNGVPNYGFGGVLALIVLAPLLAVWLAAVIWLYYTIGNYFLRVFLRMFK